MAGLGAPFEGRLAGGSVCTLSGRFARALVLGFEVSLGSGLAQRFNVEAIFVSVNTHRAVLGSRARLFVFLLTPS